MSYLMILYFGIAAVVLHGMCWCSEIKNWVKSILRVSLSPPKTSEDGGMRGRQERWSGSNEKVSSGESLRKGACALPLQGGKQRSPNLRTERSWAPLPRHLRREEMALCCDLLDEAFRHLHWIFYIPGVGWGAWG